MNVIYVLAYERPGFLFHTLRLIAKNPGFENNYFVFMLDYGFDERCEQVIYSFINKYGIKNRDILKINRTEFKEGKQSYALITGYRHCITLGLNLIHFIEDDVFIAKDFFKFQEEIFRLQKNLFCAIGTKNNNTNDPTIDDHTAYYTKVGNEYQSLGVTWKLEVLKNVLDFIDNDYFANPLVYCANKFPDSSIGTIFSEQDGLIRRIKEAFFSKLPISFPHVPRGFHAGFQGKGRRGKYLLDDNLELRIQQIQRICFNEKNMRWIVKNPEEFYDSQPVNLEIADWEHLHKVDIDD